MKNSYLKICLAFILGATLGIMWMIHRVELAKLNFWRCNPDVHGYGYCFADNFGNTQ